MSRGSSVSIVPRVPAGRTEGLLFDSPLSLYFTELPHRLCGPASLQFSGNRGTLTSLPHTPSWHTQELYPNQFMTWLFSECIPLSWLLSSLLPTNLQNLSCTKEFQSETWKTTVLARNKFIRDMWRQLAANCTTQLNTLLGMPNVTVLCMYVISISLITALPYMTPTSGFFLSFRILKSLKYRKCV